MEIEAIPAWVTATNAYLVIGDGGQALLVDAPPDPDAIGLHIAERGVAVTAVLLTHGHIDHTGGAGKLTANAGAIAYAHPDDDFLTLHPTDQLERIFGYVPPGSYEVPERIERLEHGQLLNLAGVDPGGAPHPRSYPGTLLLLLPRRRGSCSAVTSCLPDRSGAPIYPGVPSLSSLTR
jgi:hydroxyacylglutathione hydrolase